MLYDGIIEMKFAIPCKKLGDGDFHDKFGIFYKDSEALSFSGSINDSIHGFQNYESIKVFKTWAGTREYVESDAERFNRLLNLQNEIAYEINQKHLGETISVLCDGKSKNNPDVMSGRTEGNKIVLFSGSDDLVGKFVNIKITKCETFALLGDVVE